MVNFILVILICNSVMYSEYCQHVRFFLLVCFSLLGFSFSIVVTVDWVTIAVVYVVEIRDLFAHDIAFSFRIREIWASNERSAFLFFLLSFLLFFILFGLLVASGSRVYNHFHRLFPLWFFRLLRDFWFRYLWHWGKFWFLL